jgi:hydroxypyruvate isomerase
MRLPASARQVAREKAQQTLIENLRYAAGKLKAAGLTLLTEPCNRAPSRASS